MNPLESLLRPVASLVNRQISMTTPARELCAELDGSVIAVRVRNSALATYIEVGGNAIKLGSDYAGEPDVTITGSLLSLACLASGEAAIRSGEVELQGDAELAQAFRHLLQLAKPDLEEELSTLVGDVPAHGIGQLARRIGKWGRDARDTMRQNVSEYLQEESRALPSRYEVDSLQQKVNVLRDDVARLEARIGNLEARAACD